MTKSDLRDWKNSLTTQEIMYTLMQRRTSLKDEIADVSQSDLPTIKWKQGYIAALNDFLDIESDEESHGS